MQDFQCDLKNVLLNEGFQGFEVHFNSFDFFQSDLRNVFLSGGVENFRIFPQFSNFCLAITPCLLLDLMQISNTSFFFGFVFVPSFVHLVVDHVIRVVVIGNCNNPITTCISLGKSISTTFNASTFGTFHASNSMLVGVEVFNVHVIATSLKTLKKKKIPNVIFIEFSRIIR